MLIWLFKQSFLTSEHLFVLAGEFDSLMRTGFYALAGIFLLECLRLPNMYSLVGFSWKLLVL